MSGKLLELTQDLVFQELFGKQKNKEITAHLLSLILNREIKNIDLDANKRMLEYWSSMYDAKINSGDLYSVLKPSISILITDYRVPKLEHISKYHTKWNLREEEFKDTILTDDIEMHILEIPKINDNEMLKDELVQWLRFIKEPENERVETFMKENKYLEQAKKELEHLSGDPNFKRLLESRAGFLRDVDAKMYVSKEEGKQEEKEEIAKKLLRKGMSIEEITDITGLSKEEIQKIQ